MKSVHKFHADPDDFFRFTSSAIKRLYALEHIAVFKKR